MNYRTIAIHVNESKHCPRITEYAAGIARQHEAHLVGVAAVALPQNFFVPVGDGEISSAMETFRNYAREQAQEAVERFEQTAQRSGAPAWESHLIEDEAAAALCMQARYSDILVISQFDREEQYFSQRPGLSEFLITHSPRPVLMVPVRGKANAELQRAVIAWDDSFGAARAVTFALPMLKNAATVEVAIFDADKYPVRHGQEPGADVALFLARHGLNVEVTQRAAPKGMNIGQALASHAVGCGADLLVMGAYGHSRFRETILGSVTRTMLGSASIPTLMAH